jgi:hypothetical protein
MRQSGFDRALANFINDVASGDAVRHMADQGLSVSEIAARLQFPTEKKRVAEMVWKHYLDTGRILLTPPGTEPIRKVSYVRDEGEFGRTSLRQVVQEIPAPKENYVRCSFGKLLYRDRAAFVKRLEALETSDRDYILDLPWPLTDVWHVLDERMRRYEAQGLVTVAEDSDR